jgi:hypothetical protein
MNPDDREAVRGGIDECGVCIANAREKNAIQSKPMLDVLLYRGKGIDVSAEPQSPSRQLSECH